MNDGAAVRQNCAMRGIHRCGRGARALRGQVGAGVLLGAASLAPAAPPPELSALPALVPVVPAAANAVYPPAPWHVEGLPGQRKPYTRFDVVALAGERVLRIEADRSYGNLVHPTHLDRGGPRQLSWRWRVDEPLPRADLQQRDTEDLALRVCAGFDLPLAHVPFVERQILRAVRLRAREELPAAIVCYVWDARLAPGTVLASPFTRRLRYLVLRGPESPLHGWQREQRDIHADFLLLFGDEAGAVPPLMGVLIGADADNTQGRSVAHLADLDLH